MRNLSPWVCHGLSPYSLSRARRSMMLSSLSCRVVSIMWMATRLGGCEPCFLLTLAKTRSSPPTVKIAQKYFCVSRYLFAFSASQQDSKNHQREVEAIEMEPSAKKMKF